MRWQRAIEGVTVRDPAWPPADALIAAYGVSTTFTIPSCFFWNRS